MSEENSNPPHSHAPVPRVAKVVYLDRDVHTVIFLRCECGEISQMVMPGEWALSEILGEAPKQQTDQEFLQTMGITIP